MRKYFFVFISLLHLAFSSVAQNAKPSVIDFNKKSQIAISAHYDMPATITEGALRKKMSDSNIKGGSLKDGFITYPGILIAEIYSEKIDMYFKIIDDNVHSNLHLLTSKGYENFMNKESDSAAHERTVLWLNQFAKDVMRFGYLDGIAKNEQKLKDLEKQLKKTAKSGASLAKDKTKTEGKATSTKKEIAKRKSTLDNQNKTLEFAKAKTGTVDQMDAIKKEIKKQEDAAKKAKKNYEDALKDDADYEIEIEKIINRIAENDTVQTGLKSEMEQVKTLLAELKGKLGEIK